MISKAERWGRELLSTHPPRAALAISVLGECLALPPLARPLPRDGVSL